MEGRLPKREEVAEALTWRLEDIYTDEAVWEEELKQAEVMADRVAAFEGRLADSAQNLYDCLKAYDDCMQMLDRVGGYAHMRHDEDTGNAHYQEMQLKVQGVYVRIMEKLAFAEPEILSIPDDRMAQFYQEQPELHLQ